MPRSKVQQASSTAETVVEVFIPRLNKVNRCRFQSDPMLAELRFSKPADTRNGSPDQLVGAVKCTPPKTVAHVVRHNCELVNLRRCASAETSRGWPRPEAENKRRQCSGEDASTIPPRTSFWHSSSQHPPREPPKRSQTSASRTARESCAHDRIPVTIGRQAAS